MLQAWTDIETHLAIICASAPALKVVVVQKLKPLAKAKLPSRPKLPHSHSGASSAKGLISWPGSRHSRAEIFADTAGPYKPRNVNNVEFKHEPSKDQMEIYKNDIEKFPLEQIVHVGAWKPLPILPSSARSLGLEANVQRSSGAEDERSSFASDAPPLSPASTSDFLPIYVSGSLPPVTRHI